MKKLLFAVAAVGMLSACATTGSTLPSDVASSTSLDEKAEISIEGTYTAFSKAGQAAVTAGALDKTTFKTADAKAYSAVQAARAAYAAGNATNYLTAIAEANTAVADLATITKGSN